MIKFYLLFYLFSLVALDPFFSDRAYVCLRGLRKVGRELQESVPVPGVQEHGGGDGAVGREPRE